MNIFQKIAQLQAGAFGPRGTSMLSGQHGRWQRFSFSGPSLNAGMRNLKSQIKPISPIGASVSTRARGALKSTARVVPKGM